MQRPSFQRTVLFVAALTCCAIFTARLDFQARQSTREAVDRLAEQLAEDGQKVALGFATPDLGWLRLYPEVERAEVRGTDGRPLGSYQSVTTASQPDPGSEVRQAQSGGVQARVWARLPGWVLVQRELPLLAFSLLLIGLAWPRGHAQRAGGEETASASVPVKDGRPRLVLELDADLRISGVSQGIEAYGYSQQELLGIPVSAFVNRFHPGHPRSVLGVAHARGGAVDSVVTSSFLHDEFGAVKKVVVTLEEPCGWDITELRERYSRLQNLLEEICEHARDCVLFLDSSSRVVYGNPSFNKAAVRAFETGDELLARLDPADRLNFVNALHVALDGKPGQEFEFRLGNGEHVVILEGSLHAFRSPQSGAVLAMGIFRDVSEARRLSEELRSARERSSHSQKIEALGRLAGGVAHDFNNLLGSMILNLEAASGCLPEHCPSREFLEQISLAASKAARITRQLLLYSRKAPCEARAVSCHAVIEDTQRLVQSSLKGVTLETRLGATRDLVMCGPGQLDQVILNLVFNARDAVSEHGRILLSSKNCAVEANSKAGLPPRDYLLVEVEDDGPGVPAELQAKIFEPYFTTKGLGKGTGLGLSTVAAVVEKAGGHIGLRSTPGRTVFEVWFPLAPEEVAAKPCAPSKASEANSKRRAVLLVEDETAIRSLVQRLLERQGYQVTSVANGGAATRAMSDPCQFDLLITDMRLPEASGAELAGAFRQLCPEAPILFISGFPNHDLERQCIAGRSGFLAKPFSSKDLFGSLEALLR